MESSTSSPPETEAKSLASKTESRHVPITEVSLFSKILTAMLFVTLPLTGFWLGYIYGEETKVVSKEIIVVEEVAVEQEELPAVEEIIEETSVIETVVVAGDVNFGERGDYSLNKQGELFRLQGGGTTTIVGVEDMQLGIKSYLDDKEYEFMSGKVLDFWPSPNGKFVAYVVMIDITSCCAAPPTLPMERLIISDEKGSSRVVINETPHKGTDINFIGWLSDSERFVFYDRYLDEATQGSLFYIGEVGTSTINIFNHLDYSERELNSGVTKVAGSEPYFSPTEDLMVYRNGLEGSKVTLSNIDLSEQKTIFSSLDTETVDLKWSEDGTNFSVTFDEENKVYIFDSKGTLIEFKQYYKCVTNDKYTAFEVPRSDDVGSDYIIRNTPYDEVEEGICEYKPKLEDVRIDSFGATYLWDIWNDYLIFDQGTKPEPRNLFVYDILKSEVVFSDYYSHPAGTVKGVLEYWKPINRPATKNNCLELSEYKKQGLGARMEQYYIVDLSTLRVIPQGEFRCQPKQ